MLASVSHSPTMMAATRTGVILGTAAYMETVSDDRLVDLHRLTIRAAARAVLEPCVLDDPHADPRSVSTCRAIRLTR